MGIDLGSAWSSPRRSKLLMLTVLGLILLLLVPLYQLSDHDASGIYSHLTKYLGHDGPSENNAAASSSLSNTDAAIPEITSGLDTDLEFGDDGQSDPADDSKDDKDHDDKPKTTEVGEQETQETKPTSTPSADKLEEEDKPKATEVKATEVKEHETQETTPASTPIPNKPVEEDKPNEDKPKEDKTKATQPQETPKENKPEGNNGEEVKPEGDKGQEHKPEEQKEKEEKPSEEHKEEKQPQEFKPQDTPNNADVYPESRKSACDGFPALNNLTLVMKTGATEAFEKLPTQLLTHLQCVDDFLLFSDLEQNVGNHHVYDVLSDVASEVKQNLMEFTLYDAQANCPVSQKDCTSQMRGGWELDKYKFLHMIERTWSMRPNRKWYVFAEADSYIFWPNLIFWLNNKVTPEKHHYVGSVAMLKNMPFAHGGSGYVISGETVKMMAETPGIAHKYDLMAPHECCGDYLMALAVNATGFKVKQAHPMFNGEKPNTLPYGNGHWCEPLLTMHHMNSEEVSSAWFYEQTRKKRGILQIREMYENFMAPNLVPQRDQFDNLSDDVCYIGADEPAQSAAGEKEKSRQKAESAKNPTERQAHKSPEHCSKVCMSQGLGILQEQYDSLASDAERFAFLESKYEERSKDVNWNRDRNCFQWRYHNKVCCTAKSFKLGKPRPEQKVEDQWTSGWFVNGINKWIEAKGDCQPEWKIV